MLDVTCKTVANMIKGKTPEEIRKTFNIKNDFTPSEEEQVRSLYMKQDLKNHFIHYLIIIILFRSARKMNGVRRNKVDGGTFSVNL